MAGCFEGRQLSDAEIEGLGGESTGQRGMEVENQEGQGPLWAVMPLMMMKQCNIPQDSHLKEYSYLCMLSRRNVENKCIIRRYISH
jgi:hypothetical protein